MATRSKVTRKEGGGKEGRNRHTQYTTAYRYTYTTTHTDMQNRYADQTTKLWSI